MIQQKRVLIFGTFEQLHAGHQAFIHSAKQYGSHLLVSVARDAHIRLFKRREPRESEEVRLARIQKHPLVDQAFLSDVVTDSYDVIVTSHPHVIVLGHDQDTLRQSLEIYLNSHSFSVPVVILPYVPPSNMD